MFWIKYNCAHIDFYVPNYYYFIIKALSFDQKFIQVLRICHALEYQTRIDTHMYHAP
jgi:hypothetical protein